MFLPFFFLFRGKGDIYFNGSNVRFCMQHKLRIDSSTEVIRLAGGFDFV